MEELQGPCQFCCDVYGSEGGLFYRGLRKRRLTLSVFWIEMNALLLSMYRGESALVVQPIAS